MGERFDWLFTGDGIRPSFERFDVRKRGTPYPVAYCPRPIIIIQLIQIDDCRRLFARSVRWMEADH